MEKTQVDRDVVIATAAAIADAEGLDTLTLTRVAKDLGISQPALYRHVEGYDDLIRSLGLLGRQVLAEALSEAAIGVSDDDAVRSIGYAWRKVVLDRPGLYAATDRFPCAGDVELEEAVDGVLDLIAAALAGYDLDDDDRVHAARALRSTFHGFAHLEAGDGHPHPNDIDDTFEHIIELLCVGIRNLAR